MEQDSRLVIALDSKLQVLQDLLNKRDAEIKAAMDDLKIVLMAMSSPRNIHSERRVESTKHPKIMRDLAPRPDGVLQVIDKEELLIRDDTRVKLTSREFSFFKFLYKNAGKPVTRIQLIDQLKNEQDVTERNVDVHMFALRKKVSKVGIKIETVWGTGYKLVL